LTISKLGSAGGNASVLFKDIIRELGYAGGNVSIFQKHLLRKENKGLYH